MMNPDEKEWKEFQLSSIFDIHSGRDIYERERITGEIPYITSSASNNGIGYYVSNNNNTLERGSISVNRNGSVGFAFYHKYRALYSNDCRKLRPKYGDNEYISLFLTNQIMMQKEKYNYSYKMGTGRLRAQMILLPANQEGKPDWDYMEEYAKELEKRKLQKYLRYLSSKIEGLEYKEVECLEDKQWDEFIIEDLFNTKIGKSIDGNKVDKNSGSTAYITRREVNNALDGFIDYDDPEYLNDSFPVITIGNETATPFVQPYAFFTGTKVNILNPKEDISEYALHFISTSLRQHKNKYNYSFTVNSTRLKKQKILLPVNDEGEPEYEYMEQFVKNMMLEKYNKYINYISKRLS